MNKADDIRAVIIKHLQQYPCMQIPDLAKLVYQNEFAGGYLIVNEAESLQRLKNEVQSLPMELMGDPENSSVYFESIGNGLCRLNLARIEETGVELSTVNRFFSITAETVTGTRQGFEAKLGILRECLQDQTLPYDLNDLDTFMKAYDFTSCPPVGHSSTYRQVYNPAYRIVQSVYCDYFEVFCRIDSLLRTHKSINVAIDGYCGSGKSTLATLLQQTYNCNVIHMDHFFLPLLLRTPDRMLEPGGNIDYDRFIQEVASGLRTNQSIQYRVFNCKVMSVDQTILVPPNRLNIIEGSYSMHPKFCDLYDLKIFMQIDPNEQIRRILQRSGPDLLQRFIREWIPMENRYFTDLQILKQCDVVIRQSSD